MITFGLITFAPLLPWTVLLILLVCAVALSGWGFWRGITGTIWRTIAALVLLVTLSGPRWIENIDQSLPDHVIIVHDQTDSMAFLDRQSSAEDAVRSLKTQLQALPDVQVHEVPLNHEGQPAGTHLHQQIRAQTGAIPQGQIGAIFTITDGILHDIPPTNETATIAYPHHALIIGQEGEIDRSITISGIPGFAIVGEDQEIELDIVNSPAIEGTPGLVDLFIDGELFQQLPVNSSGKYRVSLPIENPGPALVEARISSAEGEVSLDNNVDAKTINGIRDRLRVLLVSGEPYAGLRVWRNLLKSDPSVDLVHFTILRPPEKQDLTPTRSLALIAFPVRELFEVSLPEFDLIIFDRYTRRGLLPGRYFDNIARYVEEGGALLTVTGPEYADPFSIAHTGLGRVLPGLPTGDVFRETFQVEPTEIGRRHPVSENIFLQRRIAPWHRLVTVEEPNSAPLLESDKGQPLLLLDRVGDGRVAQLLSDHVWLWSRNPDIGGPYQPLMRRLVHWLMQEPELEEDQIRMTTDGQDLSLSIRYSDAPPESVQLIMPDGRRERLEGLLTDDGKSLTYQTKAEMTGVYSLTADEQRSFVHVSNLDHRERRTLAATSSKMEAYAELTNGGVWWLNEDGEIPSLRQVNPERSASGADWAGVIKHGRTKTIDQKIVTLIPAWLGFLISFSLIAMAWWREGQRG